MTRGFDYKRTRPWKGWGAKREWPVLNPSLTDPNTYVYITQEHLTERVTTVVTATDFDLGRASYAARPNGAFDDEFEPSNTLDTAWVAYEGSGTSAGTWTQR